MRFLARASCVLALLSANTNAAELPQHVCEFPADGAAGDRWPVAHGSRHRQAREAEAQGDGLRPGERAVRHADWHSGPIVASAESAAFKRLIQGNADFRRFFPMFLCFPQVIPNDEVVCLKMYHRENEPLARLFLADEQQRRLDHLWNEHQFISRQSVVELNYLPLFMGSGMAPSSRDSTDCGRIC